MRRRIELGDSLICSSSPTGQLSRDHRLQQNPGLGAVKEVLDLEPFADKWRAFGWAVQEIDGHNVREIEQSLTHIPAKDGKPTCIIAHTIKGKGVSFMEHNLLWHYRSPNSEEMAGAMSELEFASENSILRRFNEFGGAGQWVFLVVGDLGFGVTEAFAKRFPQRYLNAGVAEQNMTGIAAGLALSGKVVFTYSIANFPILRCLEQIRNDVLSPRERESCCCWRRICLRFARGDHHATEDLAIMRALPEMSVVAPGDPVEAAAATEAIAAHDGPCYLRLGRAGEQKVHKRPIQFQLGKAIRVRQGTDITLISTGGMLQTAVEAADALSAKGLHARVLSMHTLKPLDANAVLAAARETRAIFLLKSTAS